MNRRSASGRHTFGAGNQTNSTDAGCSGQRSRSPSRFRRLQTTPSAPAEPGKLRRFLKSLFSEHPAVVPEEKPEAASSRKRPRSDSPRVEATGGGSDNARKADRSEQSGRGERTPRSNGDGRRQEGRAKRPRRSEAEKESAKSSDTRTERPRKARSDNRTNEERGGRSKNGRSDAPTREQKREPVEEIQAEGVPAEAVSAEELAKRQPSESDIARSRRRPRRDRASLDAAESGNSRPARRERPSAEPQDASAVAAAETAELKTDSAAISQTGPGEVTSATEQRQAAEQAPAAGTETPPADQPPSIGQETAAGNEPGGKPETPPRRESSVDDRSAPAPQAATSRKPMVERQPAPTGVEASSSDAPAAAKPATPAPEEAPATQATRPARAYNDPREVRRRERQSKLQAEGVLPNRQGSV